jgi:diguanylate cyclase (GGDEF)-like protein
LETAAAHDQQMQGVAELSQGLQTCHDREEAAAVLGQQLPPLLHARCGALYLVTAPEQLERAFAWGGQPFVDRLATADCWGLRLGRPFQQPVASGARKCSHFSAVGEEAPDNAQCLPLKAHDELLGLLVLAPDSASFDEVNVEAVSYRRLTLEHVSLSLGNLRLREALRQLAIRDALTGLYNRRFLEEAVHLALARAARKTEAADYPGFALLMLDIDHFKQFNDQHGHAAGDLALCRVAEALRGQTRGSDVVARYGGEEFIVVLADITLAAALDRAEQMRAAVARLEFRPLAQGDSVLLTVSIGVAHYPTQGTPTLADLLLAADQALYGAKHAGRNRVTT